MSIQTINVGAAPNDGSGDSLRVAMGKINSNFAIAQTKDASGNVGIGADPLAWNSGWKGIETNVANAFVAARYLYMNLTSNAFFDSGSAWRYNNSAAAAKYTQTIGSHVWSSAASGTAGNALTWTDTLTLDGSGNLYAGTDNSQTLGTASKRWSTVYAGTGTISTSDAREKTSITPLTEAETAAAKDLAAEIGTYQFLAQVAAKGVDTARHHVGLTVQRAIEIMTSHGLDPFRYGFICHDAWESVTDESGAIISESGDRYGFRTDELLLFLSRGFEARLAALEAK